MSHKVKYIDFGYATAREYWDEVVLPSQQRFLESNGERGEAIVAAMTTWSIIDWVWHERHPGVDTRDNTDYTKFRNAQCAPGACPALDLNSAGGGGVETPRPWSIRCNR